jgi:carbon monoxide dehydrogenase subunit G
MKVSGSAVLHAEPAEVWAALTDPAVLVRTIPGCEQLEETGPDTYRLAVTAGVASVRGSYAGEVSLTDQQPPASFTMKASGAGGPGTVSMEVRVKLDGGGDGATQLTYDADALVGGVIAGVGQRMLTGVGKKMAGDFFRAVDDVLVGSVPAGSSALPGTSAASPQETGLAADGLAATAGVGSADGKTQAPGRAVYAAPRAARGGGQGFASGVLTGAVIALAGVLAGGLLGKDGLHTVAVVAAALAGALAGGLAAGLFGRRSR